MTVGIPIKVLHEAVGHIVTVEMNSGDLLRGKLTSSEDNMNCQLSDITMTKKDGSSSHIEAAFLRGSQIRFFILPDMLKNAPFFRKDKKIIVNQSTNRGGLGRGR